MRLFLLVLFGIPIALVAVVTGAILLTMLVWFIVTILSAIVSVIV